MLALYARYGRDLRTAARQDSTDRTHSAAPNGQRRGVAVPACD